MTRSSRRAFAVAVALGLTLVACGSDDTDSDATTAATGASTTVASTGAPNDTTPNDTTPSPTEPAATTPPAPSGDPIVVGFASPDSGARAQTSYADGLQAWVDTVNSEGGIDGHPVELQRCDTQSDQNLTQQCAQGMVDNKSVVAVSGVGGFIGPTALPLFEASGLGMISVSPFTAEEFTSDNEVALNGAVLATYPALMQYFHEQGKTRFKMIRVDTASTVTALAAYQRVAGEIGIDWLGDIPIAVDAPDLLPAVTEALSENPDVLLVQALPAQLASIIQAAATLGSDVPIIHTSAAVTGDVLALPEAADRLYFTSDVLIPETGDPNAADYAMLQEKFGDNLSDGHVLGFVLGRAFQQAIEGSGGASATRESVLEFVRTGEFVDLPWMPSPLSRSTAPIAAYPAIANFTTNVKVADGKGGATYTGDSITPTNV